MSKISKFIICCIAVIISICSFVVPTFCTNITVPNDYYNIEFFKDTYSNGNYNFYTPNNSSFISIFNINLERYTYLDVMNFDCVGTISDLDGFTYEHSYQYGTFYKSDGSTNFIATINEKYQYVYNGNNNYSLKLIKYDYIRNYESDGSIIKFYPTKDFYNHNYGIDLSFNLIPRNVLYPLRNAKIKNCSFGGFRLIYELDYQNQYYFNRYSGFPYFPTISNPIYSYDTIIGRIYNQSNYCAVSLVSNNNYEFSSDKYINPSTLDNSSKNSYLYLDNNWSYENDYIKKITCFYQINTISDQLPVSNSSGAFLGLVNVKMSNGIYNGDTPFIVFYSSNVEHNNSSLIPIGSNKFYKNAEWWDIPSHLYNFFIYLIFDAPILSNFTQLVLILINFIVEIFEFFIGLFSGIDNLFFISIFLGIIVLIFLLKIIFRG